MDDKSIELYLREGSPFLPSIDEKEIKKLNRLLTKDQYELILALTISTQEAGYKTLDYCVKHFKLLRTYYPLTFSDLEIYYQGYLAPTIIILAAKVLDSYSEDQVFARLEDESAGKKVKNFKNDLQRLSPVAKEILADVNPKYPLQTVSHIFRLCQNDKTCTGGYFELGLLASEITYRNLYTYLPKQTNT